MTFRITRLNETFNCVEFLDASSHGFTLHEDKAASFETLEGAESWRDIHNPGCFVSF